jgi:protein SCO1/2
MEPPRHEHRDIHTGRVAWVIGGIALVVLLAALLSPVLLRAFGARDLRGAIIQPREQPRYLAPDLHQQLLDYRRAKHAELERYTWQDPAHQFARVPVEVAMRAMASPSPPGAVPPPNAAPDPGPGWRPHPGQALPLSLRFRDESGREVRLANYFGGRPVALVFGYFTCRGLCPEVFRGVREALQAAQHQRPAPALLAVSIDARDGAAAARERRAETMHGARGIDAHFLTDLGGSAAQLARVAGFGFRYDAASGQFAHPAGLVLVDGAGVIRDYLYGVRFDPARLAGVAPAAALPARSPLLLLCFHFDPASGRYDLAIGRILTAACAATVLVLFLWIRRERRRA